MHQKAREKTDPTVHCPYLATKLTNNSPAIKTKQRTRN